MRAGEILGDRYKLERVLGQGGMGVVWAARDLSEGRRVALKLILDDEKSERKVAEDKLMKELRQRLKREAEACMKIAHHPNVVQVLGLSMEETERHGPFMVMELLEGQSLSEHIKHKRRIDPMIAARIAADVASCLMAAHAAKLIHRDLKPANIFLHREPGMAEDEFITKVLDFGVCKDGDSVEIVDNMPTMTGMILGSVAYMSPQQALMSKSVDHRSDLWSLGVVLYEMLTGLRAFSGGVNEVLAVYAPMVVGRGLAAPVPAPSSKVRGIPATLDAVVERCTKPKPADRYASAEELARELYAFAGLPMPVPVARSSSAQASPLAGGELIDIYAPAIIASKAIPEPGDDRRFNQFAQTIPLRRMAEQLAAAPPVLEEVLPETKLPPTFGASIVGGQTNVPTYGASIVGGQTNVPTYGAPIVAGRTNVPTYGAPIVGGQTNVPTDLSDLESTVRMAPKPAPAVLVRPVVLDQAAGTTDVMRTQFLAPNAPIASPAPDFTEMNRWLEERKSSTTIPIPDLSDLDPAGGTQMLMTEPAAPDRRAEPSVTTTLSQSVATSTPRADPVVRTGRRRRRSKVLMFVAAGFGAVAVVVLVFVVVNRPKPTHAGPSVPSVQTSSPAPTFLPAPPMTSDANVPMPEPQKAPVPPQIVPVSSVNTPSGAPTSAPVAVPAPVKTPTIKTQPKTQTIKTQPKCNSKVLFGKCFEKKTVNPTSP